MAEPSVSQRTQKSSASIQVIGFGAGGQQGAIYDTIVRYDADTQTYENRTAESVTPNDDFTEWTVVLKSGIKFTDGTPYDAEAVKFGMNRHRSGLPAASALRRNCTCARRATRPRAPT